MIFATVTLERLSTELPGRDSKGRKQAKSSRTKTKKKDCNNPFGTTLLEAIHLSIPHSSDLGTSPCNAPASLSNPSYSFFLAILHTTPHRGTQANFARQQTAAELGPGNQLLSCKAAECLAAEL